MNRVRLLAFFAASSLALAAIGVGGVSAVACTDDFKAAAPVADAGPSPDADPAEEADGAEGPLDPEKAAVAMAAFAKDFAEAACARTTTCCGDDGDYQTALSMFNEGRFNAGTEVGNARATPERASCAVELQKRIGSLTGRYAVSVKEGRMVFDAARARKCVQDVKAAACGPEVVAAITTNACIDGRRSAVFKKAAQPGQKCADLEDGTLLGDCDPALSFCARSGTGTAKNPSTEKTGTCRAWPKERETCGLDRKARYLVLCNTLKGAYCSDAIGGTCSRNGKTLAPGADCDSQAGTAIDDCPPGSYCGSTVDGGANTCLPQKADGEPCTDEGQCKTTLPVSCKPPLAGGDSVCGQRRFCSK